MGGPSGPLPVNLKQLEYFVAVAELGSFSKAAVILNIAQPALSRQVRLLETDLHVTLLMRNGRGVVLTEAGKRLFDHSVGILQLVSRVREDIETSRDEPSGRIVVGLPPSMGRLLTLPLVEGFRRTLPKARLAIVEGLPAHLAEWISTGRVDLGLLHRQAGRHGDAVAALELAVNADPTQARLRNELGIAYRMHGQFAKAQAAYERAIALDPDHAAAVLNLGILHDLYLGNGAKALELYEQKGNVVAADSARRILDA